MRRMPTAGVRTPVVIVGSRHAPVQAVAPARLDHDGSRQRHQPLQIGQRSTRRTRRRFVSFLQAIDQYWSLTSDAGATGSTPDKVVRHGGLPPVRLIDRDGRAVAVRVKRAQTKGRGRSLST